MDKFYEKTLKCERKYTGKSKRPQSVVSNTDR